MVIDATGQMMMRMVPDREGVSIITYHLPWGSGDMDPVALSGALVFTGALKFIWCSPVVWSGLV